MNTIMGATSLNEMFRDITNGLSGKQKQIPSKYFYDEQGSLLFEKICELDEYYPTRCELEIMELNITEITEYIGPVVQLIELGSGNSMKTRLLLDHCPEIAMYVPVDISAVHLDETSRRLMQDYPQLSIQPVTADYTAPFHIPESSAAKRVIYFPGSTIGNLTPDRAQQFLKRIGESLSENDGLLIGVDMKKDIRVLEAAYNDSRGITAAFNKNILMRINRELDADFNLLEFRHLAFYNEDEGRIEMHLISDTEQKVRVGDQVFSFEKGETIHTENSYKYSLKEFADVTSGSFNRRKTWTDQKNYFSVQYFERC
jgi:dimethylhistidine N-methyltransferase